MSAAARRPTTFRGHGGLELRADAYGPVDGPVIVLLHGGGQTRHAWTTSCIGLAALGYQAITVDLRGHGESAWAPDADYRIDAYAGDVDAIVRTLGGRVALIGASLGGIASLLAAGELSRGLVSGLVLVDIAARVRPHGVAAIRAFMGSRPDGFASLAEAADTVAAYLPHRPRPADPSGLMKNLRRRGERLHWHWDPALSALWAGLSPISNVERLEDAARNVAAPALLVRGARSELLTPDDVRAQQEIMPNAESVEVAGAHHMVAGDANSVFDSVLQAFLLRAFPVTADS